MGLWTRLAVTLGVTAAAAAGSWQYMEAAGHGQAVAIAVGGIVATVLVTLGAVWVAGARDTNVANQVPAAGMAVSRRSKFGRAIGNAQGAVFGPGSVFTGPVTVNPGTASQPALPEPDFDTIPLDQIQLAEVRIDQEECGWEAHGNNFYLYPRQPDYMKFVRGNDQIEHFNYLDDDLQATFADVLDLLKDQAQRLSSIHTENGDLQSFQELSPAEFYRATILRNRLTAYYLETGPDFLDVSRDWSIYEEAYRDDPFYNYDLRQVRMVRRLMPRLWPPDDDLIRTAQARDSTSSYKRLFMRSNDLILDFIFINNTPKTQLLSELAVRIENVWTEIKAGPAAEPVKASADYHFKLDFQRRRNTFALEPPISFGADRSARFKVRLDIGGCPGNCALIRFEISGSALPVLSGPYKLSF